MATDEGDVVIPPCRIVTTGVHGSSPTTPETLADHSTAAGLWNSGQQAGLHHTPRHHHAAVEQASTLSAPSAQGAGLHQRQRPSLDLGGIALPPSVGLSARPSSAAAGADAAAAVAQQQHGMQDAYGQDASGSGSFLMTGASAGMEQGLGRRPSSPTGMCRTASIGPEDGALGVELLEDCAAGEFDDDPLPSPQAASDPTNNTRLVTGGDVIVQNTLLDVITSPGAAMLEVTQLFTFWRPQNECKSTKLKHLTTKQHDILYAVSGCSDVKFRIGNVSEPVRRALHDLYGLTIQGNTSDLQVWYKNRGNKEKSQAKAAAAAAAATVSGGAARRKRAAAAVNGTSGASSAPGPAVRKPIRRGESYLAAASPAVAALLEDAAAAAAGPTQVQRSGSGASTSSMHGGSTAGGAAMGGALGGILGGHRRQPSGELLGGSSKRHSAEVLLRVQLARCNTDTAGGQGCVARRSAEGGPGLLLGCVMRSTSERPRSLGLCSGLQNLSQQQQQQQQEAMGGAGYGAALGTDGWQGAAGRDAMLNRRQSAPSWQLGAVTGDHNGRAFGLDQRAGSGAEHLPWPQAGTPSPEHAGRAFGQEQRTGPEVEHLPWPQPGHERMASGGGDQVSWVTKGFERAASGAVGYDRSASGGLGYERAASGASGYERVASGASGYERAASGASGYDRVASGSEASGWGGLARERADAMSKEQQQQHNGWGAVQHIRSASGGVERLGWGPQRQMHERAASASEAIGWGALAQEQAATTGLDRRGWGPVTGQEQHHRQQQQQQQQQGASGGEPRGLQQSTFASHAQQTEAYLEMLRAQAPSPPPQPLVYCGSRDATSQLGAGLGSGVGLGNGTGVGSANASLQQELTLADLGATAAAAAAAANAAIFGRAGSGSRGGSGPLPPSGSLQQGLTEAQQASMGHLRPGGGSGSMGQLHSPQQSTLGVAPGSGSMGQLPSPRQSSLGGAPADSASGLLHLEGGNSEQPRLLLRQWMEHKKAAAAAAGLEGAGTGGRPGSNSSVGSGSGMQPYLPHLLPSQHGDQGGSFGHEDVQLPGSSTGPKPKLSPFDIQFGPRKSKADEYRQQQQQKLQQLQQQLQEQLQPRLPMDPPPPRSTLQPAVAAAGEGLQAAAAFATHNAFGVGDAYGVGDLLPPADSVFSLGQILQSDSLFSPGEGLQPAPALPFTATEGLQPAMAGGLQPSSPFTSTDADLLQPAAAAGLHSTSPFTMKRGSHHAVAGGLQPASPFTAGEGLQPASGVGLQPTSPFTVGRGSQSGMAGGLQSASPFTAGEGLQPASPFGPSDALQPANGGALQPGYTAGQHPSELMPPPRSPYKAKRPLGLADLIAPPAPSAGPGSRPPSAGELSGAVGGLVGGVDPVASMPNPTPIAGIPSFKEYLSTWISVGSQMPTIQSKHQRLATTTGASAALSRGAHDPNGPRPMESVTSSLFEGSTDLDLMNAQLKEFELLQQQDGAGAPGAGGAGVPGTGMPPPPDRAPQPGWGSLRAAGAGVGVQHAHLPPGFRPPGLGPEDTGCVDDGGVEGDCAVPALALATSMSLSLTLSMTLSLQEAPKSGPLLQDPPRSDGLSPPPSGDWMQEV